MKLTKKIWSPAFLLFLGLIYFHSLIKTELDLPIGNENAATHEALRSPAQVPVKCFSDRASDEAVHAEMLALEQAQDHHQTSDLNRGGHLFSALPQSTVNALKTRLVFINVDDSGWTKNVSSQSSCLDYACFIDSLYRVSSHEGDFYYDYFLKTGYLLAAQDFFPWVADHSTTVQLQNVDDNTLERYLWTKPELKAIWYLSHLLPKSLLHLVPLNTQHRLPRNFQPAEWPIDVVTTRTAVSTTTTSGTCAISIGSSLGGFNLYTDACLKLDPTNVFNSRQNFHQLFTHEIVHRFDVSGTSKYSEDPKFLALGGWKRNQLVASGVSLDDFSRDPAAPPLVTEYAATSPYEDLAESVSMYRTNPERLFKAEPLKYAYLKHLVFGDQDYLPAERLRAYADDVVAQLSRSPANWLPKEGCSDENCVSQFAMPEITKELARLRYEEPEACGVLADHETTVTGTALARLKFLFSSSGEGSTAESLKSLHTDLDAQASDTQLRALFLNCSEHFSDAEANAKSCYDAMLAKIFETAFSNQKTFPDSLKASEKKQFLTQHTFDDTHLKIVMFYEGLFSASSPQTFTLTNDLWNTCAASPIHVVNHPRVLPYQPGLNYVASSFLDCLNGGIENLSSELRASVIAQNGFTMFSEDGTAWSEANVLLPKIKNILDQKLQAGLALEQSQVAAQNSLWTDEIVAEMLGDRKWAPNGFQGTDCSNESSIILIQKLSAVNFRFIPWNQIMRPLELEICKRVESSF
jgi:hypothetical protein